MTYNCEIDTQTNRLIKLTSSENIDTLKRDILEFCGSFRRFSINIEDATTGEYHLYTKSSIDVNNDWIRFPAA